MTFAPRTWVVGEVVTAALLNTEIRNQVNEMIAAWTSYTPTWTASTTNPVIGNGTLTGRHLKLGRTCHVQFQMQAGGTTTFGSGTYSFAMPFTSANVSLSALGVARLSGTDVWIGQVIVAANAATAQCMFPATSTNTRGASLTQAVPESHAAATLLRGAVTYQTAA